MKFCKSNKNLNNFIKILLNFNLKSNKKNSQGDWEENCKLIFAFQKPESHSTLMNQF